MRRRSASHWGARRWPPKPFLPGIRPLPPPPPEALPGKARGVAAAADFLDRHGEAAAAPAPAIRGSSSGQEDGQGTSVVGGGRRGRWRAARSGPRLGRVDRHAHLVCPRVGDLWCSWTWPPSGGSQGFRPGMVVVASFSVGGGRPVCG
jgi:hypothetical protein